MSCLSNDTLGAGTASKLIASVVVLSIGIVGFLGLAMLLPKQQAVVVSFACPE